MTARRRQDGDDGSKEDGDPTLERDMDIGTTTEKMAREDDD
jgi:hypothetical protein